MVPPKPITILTLACILLVLNYQASATCSPKENLLVYHTSDPDTRFIIATPSSHSENEITYYYSSHEGSYGDYLGFFQKNYNIVNKEFSDTGKALFFPASDVSVFFTDNNTGNVTSFLYDNPAGYGSLNFFQTNESADPKIVNIICDNPLYSRSYHLSTLFSEGIYYTFYYKYKVYTSTGVELQGQEAEIYVRIVSASNPTEFSEASISLHNCSALSQTEASPSSPSLTASLSMSTLVVHVICPSDVSTIQILSSPLSQLTSALNSAPPRLDFDNPYTIHPTIKKQVITNPFSEDISITHGLVSTQSTFAKIYYSTSSGVWEFHEDNTLSRLLWSFNNHTVPLALKTIKRNDDFLLIATNWNKQIFKCELSTIKISLIDLTESQILKSNVTILVDTLVQYQPSSVFFSRDSLPSTEATDIIYLTIATNIDIPDQYFHTSCVVVQLSNSDFTNFSVLTTTNESETSSCDYNTTPTTPSETTTPTPTSEIPQTTSTSTTTSVVTVTNTILVPTTISETVFETDTVKVSSVITQTTVIPTTTEETVFQTYISTLTVPTILTSTLYVPTTTKILVRQTQTRTQTKYDKVDETIYSTITFTRMHPSKVTTTTVKTATVITKATTTVTRTITPTEYLPTAKNHGNSKND